MTLRTLLAAAAVACFLAPAAHAAVTEAVVERQDGQLLISWTAAPGEAVDVFLAPDAKAPAAASRLISDDDGDGRHALPATDQGRPYLLLRGRDGETLRVAERVVPLQGALNFRDAGGYRTKDGRHVRWGAIYRSAELSGLTAADYAKVAPLNIRTVYDLRGGAEQKKSPTVWGAAAKPRILTHPYELDLGGLSAAFGPGVDGAQARKMMAGFYPAMLDTHEPQFRQVFAELLRNDGALLYHCSAGKDRTGVTTALILLALGVPRDVVTQDYLLSNRYYAAQLASRPRSAEAGAVDPALARMSPEVMKVLMGVDAAFLDAFLDEIDRRHGGVEPYLAQRLGVGPQQLAALRAAYTE